jgi:Flp pilus assembly secretin CpaC
MTQTNWFINRSSLVWVLVFLLLFLPTFCWANDGPTLILGHGEQRLLHISGLKKYSIGQPIVKTLPGPGQDPNKLLIKAIQTGETDLWIWKQDGSTERRSLKVRKWKSPQDKKTQALERALSELSEVEILLSGMTNEGTLKVTLRGEISTRTEAAKISTLTRGFPLEIENETEPSLDLYESGKSNLENWLNTSPDRDSLQLVSEPETRTLAISGSLDSSRRKSEIEKKLRQLYPLVLIQLSTLPDDSPTIHFKVYLLELKKNQMRALGVEWSGSTSGGLRASPWGMRQAIQLESTIHHLETEGNARILSQPELVVRAPGQAELFAGGEIAIQTSTPYNSQVNWKTYGLTLKLDVKNVTGTKVRVDILTEVSHLDSGSTLKEIPGIQANRMKTQVDANFGRPLLLSGLLQEVVRQNAKGLPFLRKLPILGLLFGSEDYLKDRSELVAVLLPSRSPPPPPISSLMSTNPMRKNAPWPRNWISPEEEMRLRASPDFPWNAVAE